ncbi:MAG: HAD family hydrolase [Candidatus Saccharimonadia bacterium]
MIQAAVFDMDGLLIDSEPFWRKSHIEILGKYGFILTDDDVRTMAGHRTDEVVQNWKDRFGWKEPNNQIIEEQIVQNVKELISLNGFALPGVYTLIDLFESKKIPMAVASSSSPDLINAVLIHLNIKKHMSVIHSAKQEEFGKPHPGVFLTTAKKLDISPGECLVFEDSPSGVQAAISAGMKCIAVPEIPHDKSKFAYASLIVNSLNDVTWPTIKKLFKS